MHLAWALCICASAAATEPQQGELVAALTSLQKKFDGLEGSDAVHRIFCQDFSKTGEEGGLCDAIANRLNKAAGGSVLT